MTFWRNVKTPRRCTYSIQRVQSPNSFFCFLYPFFFSQTRSFLFKSNKWTRTVLAFWEQIAKKNKIILQICNPWIVDIYSARTHSYTLCWALSWTNRTAMESSWGSCVKISHMKETFLRRKIKYNGHRDQYNSNVTTRNIFSIFT